MSKPFTPKLGPARPRLSVALNAPELAQFTPRMLAAVKGALAKPAKQQKSKLSAAQKALTGNF